MGVCGSKPEVKQEAAAAQPPAAPAPQPAPAPAAVPSKPEAAEPPKGVQIVPAGERSTVAVLPPWVKSSSLSTAPGGEGMVSAGSNGSTYRNATADAVRMNLSEVKAILQQLPGVNPNPTIGLAEAAQLLRTNLNVSLVSIVGCTEGLTSYILLAAHGSGAAELEKHIVMKGADWSPYQVEGLNSYLCLSAEDDEKAEVLPKDWQALYRSAGLRSFLAVSIGTPAATLGLLTVAKEEPHAFDDEWWEPMLGVLAVGLLPQLRNEHISYLCHLVRVLDATTDHLSLIAMLLQGAHRMLLKTTNIKIGVRLGLLNKDHTKALIFEVDTASMGASMAAEVLTGSAREGLLGDISITEIGLENTLLLDAVNKGKARFVSDCASYLQSCMKPATDIFISSQQMVASIVVLPLIYGSQNMGGLYFTLENPSNFQNIKDMLMGFVNSVVLLLHQKLEGQLQQMWEAVVQRSLLSGDNSMDGKDGSFGSTQASHPPVGSGGFPNIGSYGGGAGSTGLPGGGGLGGGLPSGFPPAAAAAGAANGSMGDHYMQQQGMGGGIDGSSGTVGKQLFVKRSCTEAMLKVLQHEIRKTHAKSSKIEWIDELVLLETIGKGGFGVVYKGTWKGSLAAIKVMYARQHERQAMKDALEMAVLTTVTHPNIIQVYSCFTDMVEDAGTSPALGAPGSGAGEGRINVRFRRLRPDENKNLATCNIVVMEYCDKGSLRHAMKRGVFHKRLGNTSVAVDLCAIVQVLLEVAHSVQHLHNIKLLHCDIKPENVLLKSDTTSPLGFTTKLSDFGLAKLLRENYYIVNRSGSGTVTHLAPELFQVGSKITTGVDTFSFGIMMWELYTGQRAYSGLGRDAIIDRVYKKQSRPVFPSGVPALYSHLAQSCWETDVALRPKFATILARLNEMLAAFQSGTYAGASAAAEAVRERLQQAAEHALGGPPGSVVTPAAPGAVAGGAGGGSLPPSHPATGVGAPIPGPTAAGAAVAGAAGLAAAAAGGVQPWGPLPGSSGGVGPPYAGGVGPGGDLALQQQLQQQLYVQQQQQQQYLAQLQQQQQMAAYAVGQPPAGRTYNLPAPTPGGPSLAAAGGGSSGYPPPSNQPLQPTSTSGGGGVGGGMLPPPHMGGLTPAAVAVAGGGVGGLSVLPAGPDQLHPYHHHQQQQREGLGVEVGPPLVPGGHLSGGPAALMSEEAAAFEAQQQQQLAEMARQQYLVQQAEQQRLAAQWDQEG